MPVSSKVKKVYLGVTNVDEKLFKDAARITAQEWGMHGLYDTMYEEYARRIFSKYIKLLTE